MPREIIRTSTYKRDIKREMKGRYRHSLESDLMAVYELLVTDQPLPASYQDHPLQGIKIPTRDCHVHPDLLLLYQKPEGVLRLVRLGSHAELFG